MSWINDAANKARQEDEESAKRREAFLQQSQMLWGGLRSQIQRDVAGINQNQELIKRRLGGERLEVQEMGGGLQIVKIVYPAVYLSVTFDGERINVERKIVTNGERRRTRTEREQINFEMDSDYNLSMKNDNEDRLNIPEASRYILTPLLNTHTIV